MNGDEQTQTESIALFAGVNATFHGGVAAKYVEMPFRVKHTKTYVEVRSGDGGYGMTTIYFKESVSEETRQQAVDTVLNLLTIKYSKG